MVLLLGAVDAEEGGRLVNVLDGAALDVEDASPRGAVVDRVVYVTEALGTKGFALAGALGGPIVELDSWARAVGWGRRETGRGIPDVLDPRADRFGSLSAIESVCLET